SSVPPCSTGVQARDQCQAGAVRLSFGSVFFSGRRRHTRWPRDWSSDVCSSDLPAERWDPSKVAAKGALDVIPDVEPEDEETPQRSEERRVGKECRSRWAR